MAFDLLESMFLITYNNENKERKINYDAIAIVFAVFVTSTFVNDMDSGDAIKFCIPLFFLLLFLIDIGKSCYQLLKTVVVYCINFITYLYKSINSA